MDTRGVSAGASEPGLWFQDLGKPLSSGETHTHTQIGRLSHRSPHLLSLLTDQLAFDDKEKNRHFFWTRFNHVCVKILES